MQNIEDKAQEIKAVLEKFIPEVIALKVVDEETNTKASEFLGQIKTRADRIEELRTSFVKPLNEQVDFINNTFKAEAEPLKKAEAYLKEEMVKYFKQKEEIKKKKAQEEYERVMAERKRIAEEREKLAEEKRKLEKEAQDVEALKKLKEQEEALAVQEENNEVVPEEEIETSVKTSSGTTSVKRTWQYKVYDEELLRKTHPEFFILDTKKVNAFVQYTKEEQEKDGLKIYQEVSMAHRV